MGEVAGSKLKVRINGQVFKASRVSVQDRVDLGNITASESLPDADGVVRKQKLPQTGDGTLTITNATYDPEENAFVAPRNIRTGVAVAVRVYPDGLDGEPWDFPRVFFGQVGHDIDVNALQPLTLTGETDGVYYTPGNAP
jgi:hypothetical protein